VLQEDGGTILLLCDQTIDSFIGQISLKTISIGFARCRKNDTTIYRFRIMVEPSMKMKDKTTLPDSYHSQVCQYRRLNVSRAGLVWSTNWSK
jgi:hypothetical protein